MKRHAFNLAARPWYVSDHRLAIHMLGNAVPPPMTETLINALKEPA